MKQIKLIFFLTLVISLFFPSQIFAAEILQVRSSSLLLIGDHNRTYTVRIACLQVEPSKEEDVRDWLKEKLPRRTRVNLYPRGSIDGILVAGIKPIGSSEELIQDLIFEGLASSKCQNDSSLIGNNPV